MQELSLEDSNETLPMPESLSNVFIWSLLDIREKQEPCRLLVTSPCFPIQTASPDPVQYKIWTKEKVPLFTGLPLWTRDELIQGCVFLIIHFCPPHLSALHPGCNVSVISMTS